MNKHFLTFGAIILFLVLAFGSTNGDIEDVTDLDIERDCRPLSTSLNKAITCYINVTDKITAEPVSNADIEIWVRFLKFEIANNTECYGFLEIASSNLIDFFTDESGSYTHVTESFFFDDQSDVIEIKVICNSPEKYDFQSQTKEAIFKWSSVELAEFNFSLLSNNDL